MHIDYDVFKKVEPRMSAERNERLWKEIERRSQRAQIVDVFFWNIVWLIVIILAFTMMHCNDTESPPGEDGNLTPIPTDAGDSGLTLEPRDSSSDAADACDSCTIFLDCDGAAPDASPECLAQNE